MISSWGRPAKERLIFETSGGASPMISSSSIPTLFRAWVVPAAVAAALATMWASDSPLISSSSSSNFLAAAALSSSAFQRMILKILSFCSYVMLDCIYRVND